MRYKILRRDASKDCITFLSYLKDQEYDVSQEKWTVMQASPLQNLVARSFLKCLMFCVYVMLSLPNI